MFCRSTAFVVLLVCVSLPIHSPAIDVVWDNGGATNSWDEDANWDGDLQPTPTDAAIFGAGGPASVDTAESVDQLVIQADGQLTLVSPATVEVGAGGVNNLNLLNITGGVLSVGSGGLQNEGTVSVDGTNEDPAELSFTASGVLNGSGAIEIDGDGAAARISAGAGAAIIHGATHTISGAGLIDASIINEGTIIAFPNNANVLTVSGALTNNNVMRAQNGATLRIADTAIVQQTNNGDRIVAGNGGVVELAGGIIIGGRLQAIGAGRIDVTADSGVADIELFGPVNILAGESIAVTGPTLFNDDTLTVASDGVSEAATLAFDTDTTINGLGEVVLEGPAGVRASLDSGENVVTNSTGHTIRGAGEVLGELVNNGRLEGASATELLTVAGRVSGEGVLRDVEITGVHAPGESPAAVVLEGIYNLAAGGQLEIEIGGIVAGSEYDQLNAAGDVTLAGELVVNLIDEFMPADGDAFTILTSTSITGQFSNGPETLPALTEGLEWDIEYNATDVILRVAEEVAMLVGDFNDDGVVDTADYTVWRDGLGAEFTIADYTNWKNNFGATTGGGGATATPEPVSLLLLAAVGLLGPCRRFD